MSVLYYTYITFYNIFVHSIIFTPTIYPINLLVSLRILIYALMYNTL